MEPSSTVSTPVDAPARLSFAQKRDLCGQAVAAVITTALIAAPLVTQGPATAPAAALAAPAMDAVAAAVPASAALAAVVPAAAFSELAPASLRIAVTPVARNAIASTPPARRRMRPIPAISRAVNLTVVNDEAMTPVAVTVTASAARDTQKKTLSRRLTGWLIGNGTPSVRPFPLVPAGSP